MFCEDGQGSSRLTELCPLDKARIGRLIDQLLAVTAEHKRCTDEWAQKEREAEQKYLRLRTQNDTLVQDSTALRRKFGETLRLVESYQAKLHSTSKYQDDWKRKYDLLQSQFGDLQGRYAQTVNENKNLQEQLEGLQAETQQFGANVAKLTHTLKSCQAERAELRNQVQHLQEEIRQREIESHHSQERLVALEARESFPSETMQALQLEVVQLRSKLAHLQSQTVPTRPTPATQVLSECEDSLLKIVDELELT